MKEIITINASKIFINSYKNKCPYAKSFKAISVIKNNNKK
jgi:hypothetical protein